jgi:hypothetical protein
LTQGTIDPWDAFWVQTYDDPTDMRIHRTNLNSTFAKTDGAAQPALLSVAERLANNQTQKDVKAAVSSAKTNEASWMLNLRATTPSARDIYSYIGIHSQATSGYDETLEALQLQPRGEKKVMLYFPQDRVNLTSDLRGGIMSEETWNMTVETQNINEAVTLDWPNISDVPLNYGVSLVAVDENNTVLETVNMRNNATYTFVPAMTAQPSSQESALSAASNLSTDMPVVSTGNTTGQTYRFQVHVYEVAVSAQLASFEAASREKGVELLWTTSVESNDHAGFQVYRANGQAIDLKDFTAISSALVVSQNGSYTFMDNNVKDSETYTYLLTTVNTNGDEVEAGRLSNVTYSGKQFIFALKMNYPNPFNPSTTIAFNVPATGKASLKIYNAAGQLVRSLIDGKVEAGYHTVVWNGRNDSNELTASGVYFYVLKAGDKTATRKMIMLK